MVKFLWILTLTVLMTKGLLRAAETRRRSQNGPQESQARKKGSEATFEADQVELLRNTRTAQ